MANRALKPKMNVTSIFFFTLTAFHENGLPFGTRISAEFVNRFEIHLIYIQGGHETQSSEKIKKIQTHSFGQQEKEENTNMFVCVAVTQNGHIWIEIWTYWSELLNLVFSVQCKSPPSIEYLLFVVRVLLIHPHFGKCKLVFQTSEQNKCRKWIFEGLQKHFHQKGYDKQSKMNILSAFEYIKHWKIPHWNGFASSVSCSTPCLDIYLSVWQKKKYQFCAFIYGCLFSHCAFHGMV